MKLLNTQRKRSIYSSRASCTTIPNDRGCFFFRHTEHGSFIPCNACTQRNFPWRFGAQVSVKETHCRL